MTRPRTTELDRYVFDLSNTEWQEWPDAGVINAARFAALRAVNAYPDRTADRVRDLLADRHGIQREQIVLGNGAGDLLQTAALALLSDGDELVTPWPSYPLYPVMARRAKARAVPVALNHGGIDLELLRASVNERTRVLTLCNPNDPTGTYLSAKHLADLLSSLPEHVHMLLDETLIHFQAQESEDACLHLVDKFPRLIVFRSFSNAYGLAGLRAGYAVVSTEAARLLDSLAPVLGVNALTQAAVEYALRRGDALLASRREMVIALRRRVEEAISKLPCGAPKSDAHFVWLRMAGMTSWQLAAAFEHAGVLVYPGALLGDADHVRISLKDPAATDRLLTELTAISTTSNAAQRAANGTPPTTTPVRDRRLLQSAI